MRTYKALHSGKYQLAMSAIATAVNTLSAVPPVNVADIELKNQGISTIKLMQSQMTEVYNAQQEYLQARIEVTQEVRQSLAQMKSGKTKPGGILSPVAGVAAGVLLKTAINALP